MYQDKIFIVLCYLVKEDNDSPNTNSIWMEVKPLLIPTWRHPYVVPFASNPSQLITSVRPVLIISPYFLASLPGGKLSIYFTTKVVNIFHNQCCQYISQPKFRRRFFPPYLSHVPNLSWLIDSTSRILIYNKKFLVCGILNCFPQGQELSSAHCSQVLSVYGDQVLHPYKKTFNVDLEIKMRDQTFRAVKDKRYLLYILPILSSTTFLIFGVVCGYYNVNISLHCNLYFYMCLCVCVCVCVCVCTRI
jgi:hypothetical protein